MARVVVLGHTRHRRERGCVLEGHIHHSPVLEPGHEVEVLERQRHLVLVVGVALVLGEHPGTATPGVGQ